MDTQIKDTDRILITGGRGFLGGYVVDQLRARGYYTLFTPRRQDYNLTYRGCVDDMYGDLQPDVVIHLAASVGGIGANQDNPGKYFYDNLAMGMNMIEGAREFGVKKFVQVGTICSYPANTPVPFRETDLWNGYPEETNAPYGIAKKALLTMCQAYRKQYGLNAIYLLPVNLYGPRDNFDLQTSHVIPALIRKCLEAKRNGDVSITAWGTGNASREFLYVEDCADGLVDAMERYNDGEPVNLGSGVEIKITQLAFLIAHLCGYEGEILWDSDKPDGQSRRYLDTNRARERFGFLATTSLLRGLKRTIEWYVSNSNN